MFAKIEITGTMEIVTGLHIGGNGAFAAIGAVDSPVIRDALSGEPIIPGSSVKGKLRTLLSKKYNEKYAMNPDQDNECITALFGTAKNSEGKAKTGRLLFSDMFIEDENKQELKNRAIRTTEVKFENSISRTTAIANPRQIERIIRGVKFGLNLIYEMDEENDVQRDFELLKDGLNLLQYDYLGGSGSRGYGKVKFSNLFAETVVGEVDDKVIDICNNILAKV